MAARAVGSFRNISPRFFEGLAAAEIKTIVFQVLRRSCTTRNQKHGSLKDVQTHMGHASIGTTGDVYMQEIPESVERMVALDEMDVLGAVQ